MTLSAPGFSRLKFMAKGPNCGLGYKTSRCSATARRNGVAGMMVHTRGMQSQAVALLHLPLALTSTPPLSSLPLLFHKHFIGQYKKTLPSHSPTSHRAVAPCPSSRTHQHSMGSAA